MPVTYTNCKGVTYYLCRGVRKSGTAYYYFAREPKGEPVEEIPEGYIINESVNGFVTLSRDRPLQIWPEETAAVEAALGRHPKGHNYQVSAKGDQIVVHERVGPDTDELVAHFRGLGLLVPGGAERFREGEERRARFKPVLRFTLSDAERRTFRAERWCYLGSIDDWIDIGAPSALKKLVRDLIPRLGNERFFEWY